MKLGPMLATFVLVFALFFASFSGIVSAEECTMLRDSQFQAQSCPGCCATMKCCSLSKQDEKSQAAQPPSDARLKINHDHFLAVVPRLSTLLYALPSDRNDNKLFKQISAIPIIPSLTRLCVHLI